MVSPRRVAKRALRWGFYVFAALVVLVGAALVALETGWAKNQLRALIVRQANQFLTATLEIDSLGGSLFRGLHLGGVRVSRDGQTLVGIEAIELSYSIRELFQQGTVLRRVIVTRPVVVAGKLPDGRWELGALVRRNAQQGQQRGPGRPLHIQSIEVVDGTVSVTTPLTLGMAHLPTEFSALNARLSFDYVPVTWRLDFERASWLGRSPTFDVNELSGTIRNSPEGWAFDNLRVQTPRSHVLVAGLLDRRVTPSQLSLDVRADRFAFSEWGGVITSVATMGIEGPFTAVLRGPVKQLDTTLDLASNGGAVAGRFTIDTTLPGWRAAGRVAVQRLDLARWLSKPDDASDISGDVTFDVGMPPGSHFPRGAYAFDGSHARFMAYEADDVVARGQITDTEVRIAGGTATAYGANVRLDGGTIGIDAPYPFAFTGLVNGIDLRQLPANVPVPHVESTLFFGYDVRGQFRQAYLQGHAAFHESSFLGITIGEGGVGSIDTLAQPFTYSGDADLRHIELPRVGAGLGIAWMQEPRYQGTIDGRFHVEGAGSSAATMQLTGGGRLTSASLFSGHLTDADVSIEIAGGTLTGGYDGRLDHINPALAMNDPQYQSVLTGTGRGRVTVRELMRRAVSLDDYTIDAALSLTAGSEVRALPLEQGEVMVRLVDSTLMLDRLEVRGPAVEAIVTGALALDGVRSSALTYDVRRANLLDLNEFLGRRIEGELVTTGRLSGPLDRVRVSGDGTLSGVKASGVQALTATLSYDATIPAGAVDHSVVSADGTLTFVEAFGQEFREISGKASFADGAVSTDVRVVRADGLAGTLAGEGVVNISARALSLSRATIALGQSSWTLLTGQLRPRISWNEQGIVLERIALVDAAGGVARLTADGTWYPTGGGALHVTAIDVSIDALSAGAVAGGPARYGGTLNADAVIGGTRAVPTVNGSVSIVEGRVWRTAFEQLEGRIDYAEGDIVLNLRLDQSPGVWLTAAGRVPADVLTLGRKSVRPMRVEVRSSRVGLGLVEGLTNVVRDVSGVAEINVNVLGVPGDPHFDGRVDIADAGFLVTASGARYRNGRVALQFASEKVTVETLRLEDRGGHPLEVTGALATHELRVGDLQMAIKAREFEVLRNEFGQMDIDADLSLQGQFEAPFLDGRITVRRGELQVDSILDRTLFRPYATTAAPAPSVTTDAIVVLNPWERMTLGIELHVPGTLRLVGDNIQVSPGTPLGLGAINLRALGDLYFYKGAGQPLYLTGSLDSVTGTYAFQGRRFDLDPGSSINFRGDFNPDIYVGVERVISGVTTRVTIAGLLTEPALRLSSTPPLDPSDILSLIVFNTSTNELNASQQQQLAGRAATIAAGFLAAPILTAIEQSLGIDTLEIAPDTTASGGTRVTIGNEIAPGLVARFSRQFGNDQYDEATLEYFLSRLFRLRATFSDASSLGTRSPFRRVERAGIDFLVFFSF